MLRMMDTSSSDLLENSYMPHNEKGIIAIEEREIQEQLIHKIVIDFSVYLYRILYHTGEIRNVPLCQDACLMMVDIGDAIEYVPLYITNTKSPCGVTGNHSLDSFAEKYGADMLHRLYKLIPDEPNSVILQGLEIEFKPVDKREYSFYKELYLFARDELNKP